MNREKSSIRHAADTTLLGFGFILGGPQVTIRVAPKTFQELGCQAAVLISWLAGRGQAVASS